MHGWRPRRSDSRAACSSRQAAIAGRHAASPPPACSLSRRRAGSLPADAAIAGEAQIPKAGGRGSGQACRDSGAACSGGQRRCAGGARFWRGYPCHCTCRAAAVEQCSSSSSRMAVRPCRSVLQLRPAAATPLPQHHAHSCPVRRGRRECSQSVCSELPTVVLLPRPSSRCMPCTFQRRSLPVFDEGFFICKIPHIPCRRFRPQLPRC